MDGEFGGMDGDFETFPEGSSGSPRTENVRPMDSGRSSVEQAVRELVPRLEGVRLELDRLRATSPV